MLILQAHNIDNQFQSNQLTKNTVNARIEQNKLILDGNLFSPLILLTVTAHSFDLIRSCTEARYDTTNVLNQKINDLMK